MKGNQIDGQPVTEEQLLKEGYRKYTGEGIDIFYNINCQIKLDNSSLHM
ncbi:hypothetical protein M1G39_08860 [Enterococcus faecalis]|nr:hypothetical protein [Enterococcus faecalis]MCK8536367.1 hypothetical protein [Enterococcus faecalis]